MEKFYFTYGTSETYPFYGGWTEVIAPDRHAAVAAFRGVHPDIQDNIVNCAFIYNEEQFKKTCMADGTGNINRFCHEHITLTVEPCDPKEPA